MPFDILIAILLLLAVAFIVYLLCRIPAGRWRKKYEHSTALLTTEQTKNQYLIEQQEQVVQERDEVTLQLTNSNQAKQELAISLKDRQADINKQLKTIQGLRTYEIKCKQLEQDNELHNRNYKKLQKEQEDLLAEQERTQKKLREANKKIKELQGGKQRYQATQKQIQQNLEEAQAKLTRLQQEKEQIRTTLTGVQQENNDLIQAVAAKDALIAERQQALGQMDGMTTQNQDLLQQITALQKQEESVKEENAQALAGLNQDIILLQATSNRFASDLKKGRQKNEQQLAELQQLRAANTNLLAQVTQLEKTQEEQGSEEKKSEDGVDWQKIAQQLKDKVKHITGYNHELSIALEDCRDGKTAASTVTADAKVAAAIEHRDQEIEQHRQTVKDLKDKLTTEGQAKYNLAAELKTLQRKFSQLSETTTQNASEQAESTAQAAAHQLSTEMADLQEQLATQQQAVSDKTTEIDRLQETISELKATNQELSRTDEEEAKHATEKEKQVATLTQQVKDLEATNAELLTSVEHKEAFVQKAEQLKSELNQSDKEISQKGDLLAAQQNKLDDLQQRLTECQQAEIIVEGDALNDLQAKLTTAKNQLVHKNKIIDQLESAAQNTDTSPQLTEKFAALQAKSEQDANQLAEQLAVNEKLEAERANLLQQIEAAKSSSSVSKSIPKSTSESDDLTKISGIGRFIAKKLNGLGITTYQQIAAFTPEDIQRVTDATESFPGRIERDDWVQQAKMLLKKN